ncbi:CU044_2847 family protein [Okeania sp. KiyG1]|uniref:CU044_2847 family protein n=1 Tax=Okeania sp. KiyG1 TaxID=2720165 RepID=UPI00272EC120|nr:CU044_2847 family protein [Okeania sp. KiyG1]
MVKFQLDDDEESFVYMEVDEKLLASSNDDQDEGLIGIGDEVAKQAKQTLGKAFSSIKPVANAIIKKVLDLNKPADAVEVKFGVKMSGELGAIIASGSAEVNYEITLKWNNTKSKED